MHARPWRIALLRGTAAFSVVLAIVATRPARSAPGDIFTIPAPVIGADPPKSADLKTGDATVATQTGALQYSYPIAVPPGRNGLQPSLALSYSSQGATYGGVAAGWTLSIPMISEDHAWGRLATRSPLVELFQSDPGADDRFVSSLAGGRPLVPVTEPFGKGADVYMTYRAQGDSSWARYERLLNPAIASWRVRTTDGIVMMFGEPSRAPGCPLSARYAPLTGMYDPFGNEVSYHYKWSGGECIIQQIFYGQNNPSGLSTFARVDIVSDTPAPCHGVYPNSQSDYRTGDKIVTGANRISAINAYALQPGTSTVLHTRQITLTYDLNSVLRAASVIA